MTAEVHLTASMRVLAGLLERRTGQVLAESRLWRLETSLKPILRMNRLSSLDELVAAIRGDPGGALERAAVNALLNNETSFFRDAHNFHMVGRGLLPEMMQAVEKSGREKVLRLWCAGCSTGQEAYSLAMLFRNNQDRWPGWRMRIVATDISTAALDRAREGLFAQIDVQRGLAINDLLRWFEPVEGRWRIHPSLCEMIDFRVDNLFEGKAVAGTYDIIFCRNVLLYFSPGRKKELFRILSRHSAPGSHLLLGAGETVIGHSDDFIASRRFRGIYERIEQPAVEGGL